MRFISMCAILLVFGLAFTCQSYAEIDPATVAGLWLFNEGEGDVAEDSSGNGNDGTFAGSGAAWVDAKYGKGLEFDGAGWLECGKGESLDFKESTNFSIHSIVKATAANAGKIIIWKGLGCSTWSQWLLGTGEHENAVNVTNATFHIRNTNGGGRSEVRAPDELPEGEWVQVAGSYDGATLKIYIDGNLVNEAEAANPPWACLEQVYVAADPGCGVRGQWVGIIDEIAIFNVTLEDADVKALANGYEGGMTVSPAGRLATVWGHLKTY